MDIFNKIRIFLQKAFDTDNISKYNDKNLKSFGPVPQRNGNTGGNWPL